MIIKTAKQLKDLTNNLSKKIGIDQRTLYTKYMLERLLERISKSKYNTSFILKGGMLISSFVGTEERTTMDIDTTVKGISLTKENMTEIIKEISDIEIGDNVSFKIKKTVEIMQDSKYSGVRFHMDGKVDKTVIPFKIDISTGDVITPREIVYSYQLMFGDRSIPVLSYPIETVLAEKLEAVLSLSTDNTRMRDFYDIKTLAKMQEFDKSTLKTALERTTKNKGHYNNLSVANEIVNAVKNNQRMRNLWRDYCEDFPYARKYTWDDVVNSVKDLLEDIDIIKETEKSKKSFISEMQNLNKEAKKQDKSKDHKNRKDLEI